MRSRHADRFNHDEDASGYDRNVQNEADPIRAGYAALLRWVADRLPGIAGPVLELGSGTGNLTQLLPADRAVCCVDISMQMQLIAAQKIGERAAPTDYVLADLLGFFDEHDAGGPYAAVVSTYAIHHLEDDEKEQLFARLRACLLPGGAAVFGDLMFADAGARKDSQERCIAEGKRALAEDIDDEYFWLVDHATAALEGLGFVVESRQFSDLSWGIVARLPA